MLLSNEAISDCLKNQVIDFFSEASQNMKIVLDEDRKIILADGNMVKFLGHVDFKSIHGLTLGEAIKCDSLVESEKDCGQTKFCQYCFFNSVFEKLQKDEDKSELPVSSYYGECYRIYSKELKDDSSCLIALMLENISEEKRREGLERVFFHDLLNSASSIEGAVSLLEDSLSLNEDDEEILDVIRSSSMQLVNEIKFHQKLSLAKEDKLHLQESDVYSFNAVKTAAQFFSLASEVKGVRLEISCQNEKDIFYTDESLLIRVLVNLIKNAIEASKDGDIVRVQVEPKLACTEFMVTNPSQIPLAVQPHIFKYSFSTKGQGRGIGTYSVKLFVEKYLGGTIKFTSDESGTTFIVSIPKE